jgi:hypothetical protein
VTLSGQLTEQSDGSVAGTFSAAPTYTSTPPAPVQGAYTFALVSNAAPPGFTPPDGAGCGVIRIDRLGTARFSGNLADGSAVSWGGNLSQTGDMVLVRIIGTSGFLTGDIEFADISGQSDASGTLHWQSAPHPGTPLGTTGMADLTLVANRYTAPASGNRLLTLDNTTTNALITAESSKLTSTQLAFTINTKDVASPPSPNPQHVAVTVSSASGYLRGSFRVPGPPVTTVAFTSVALQKQNGAYGYFKYQGGTGLITIGSNPNAGQ